jgi:cytochrome c
MNTTEELLGRKSSGCGLHSLEQGHKDPSRWPRGTLYPQKLALTSQTSGGRSVGIVCSRTQATKYFFPRLFRSFRWGAHLIRIISQEDTISRSIEYSFLLQQNLSLMKEDQTEI